MAHPVHPSRPPEIDRLLEILETRGVRFVLAGSVAAQLHGVDLVPGDLDIIPATDPRNLTRLVAALAELEATHEGPPGEWQTTLMHRASERRVVMAKPPAPKGQSTAPPFGEFSS